MSTKKTKNAKPTVEAGDYATRSAKAAWAAIGAGAASPIQIIAEAVQLGIMAGIDDTKLRMAAKKA